MIRSGNLSLVKPQSSSVGERWLDVGLLYLFIMAWFLVALREIPGMPFLREAFWLDGVFLVMAMLTTVSTLSRQIPFQNVLMAAPIIALIGAAAHWTSFVSGIPFGPIHVLHANGNSIFQEWIAALALVWVVAVLNARGVAHLLLQSRVGRPNYGLHVMLMTAALVVGLGLGIEPFASRVHRYWLWGETRLPVTWYGAPLTCLFAWGSVTLIALVAATAVLIRKHPSPMAPSLRPLLVWTLLNLLFALAGLVNHLWTVAATSLGVALVPALVVLAIQLKQERTN